jgi:hypothetical protein
VTTKRTASPTSSPAIEVAGAAALRGATFGVGDGDGVNAGDPARVAGEAIDRCQQESRAATAVLERVGTSSTTSRSARRSPLQTAQQLSAGLALPAPGRLDRR